MKPTALFVSNSIYFDESKNEGGVKLCTGEYLALLKTVFNVILFPVHYHTTILYRARVKLGLNVYNDYHPVDYKKDLIAAIKVKNVNIVFLNLSNTASIAAMIKKEFNGKVWFVEANSSIRRFLENLFFPIRILKTNMIWLPDGNQVTQVTIESKDYEKFFSLIEKIKKIVNAVRKIELVVEIAGK